MELRRLALCAVSMLTLVGASAAEARPRHHGVTYSSSYAGGDEGYYTNVDGHSVHRPTHCGARPAGATARCGDGTWSFSQHHSGTCSHHGGVLTWL